MGWPLEARDSGLQFLLREKHKTAFLGTKRRGAGSEGRHTL